ncbi:hypothetical protein QTP70_028291 [Hemibagrus guttatus]|uniref:ribonuclease H n=1 Tax=Hemibagrus guttatus TaxID=175788 RepID=A0AAE0QTG2_9TELE|nr:hypothetical protein QTP70_028291 [Hemibagrus guttatus]
MSQQGQRICRRGTERPCYKIAYHQDSGYRVSFEEARRTCREDEGELLSIETESEQRLMEKFVQGAPVAEGDFWIGLRRNQGAVECSSQYYWLDHSQATYRNWLLNEPSCGFDQCVALYYRPNAPASLKRLYMFKWSDIRCNSKNNFICKYAEDPLFLSIIYLDRNNSGSYSGWKFHCSLRYHISDLFPSLRKRITIDKNPTGMGMAKVTCSAIDHEAINITYILLATVPVLLLIILVVSGVFCYRVMARNCSKPDCDGGCEDRFNDGSVEVNQHLYREEKLLQLPQEIHPLLGLLGKGRELADMMERRKVDILCVQETRWKGSKVRSIGAGFKLFYYGVDSKRNGVGVVLKEEFVRNVLEVKRVSDRVMSLKLEIEGVMLNVVSGYAPQVGCELEEKERFWSELDEVMESIPTGERVVIGADFNGHVGEGNTGDEEVMGKFGVKERNLEGQMVVDFAKRMDMAVVNTYFQKREEHRVTYKSGGRRTQVDYILCRRGNLKEISNCKVVVGESVARQHRMVCKKKRSKIEKKTKWWKLKKEECCEEFRQMLRQALGGQVVLPDDWETTAEVIRETGRKVLGVSSGRRKEDKETWWWNEEVQDSVQRKRLAKKKWDMDRTEENRQEYKELQRRVKREVSKAKQKTYDELHTRLDTREGEKDLYRLARQRDRDGKDVQQVRVIKDRDGRVLTSEESVQRRWKEYFEELMNEENEREKRVEGVNSVEQKVDKIRKDEVRKALKRMKSGKAVGPDDIPVEVWTCLGEAAVEFLTSLFNRVLESERMPEEWRRSVLVPIFKNKGDVQSCSNYRGIKLMSHTMKLWERVVEARLRKVVEICEQQYGFMPRKSTTDAIFALRILMEKYRDGQRELHCVFVDLEKAYDRVPREELWYCMRKSGVAEKYVRVVQDMYERSRTVVRCAVGQTEEFKVEVGLHQGSALSPFMFAIVMDQLSEEVRQESPWTMMFADDIVICSESREQVEENLERWRFALERRGMKVSRSKTQYMCVNEREGSGTVRLQGEEVKKVQEFKYLGSTVQSNGECAKEVKKRKEQNDIYAVPGQWVPASALKNSSSPGPKEGPRRNGAQLEYMSSEINRTFSSTDYENVPSNTAGFVTNDIYETCSTPATMEAGWVDNDIYGY